MRSARVESSVIRITLGFSAAHRLVVTSSRAASCVIRVRVVTSESLISVVRPGPGSIHSDWRHAEGLQARSISRAEAPALCNARKSRSGQAGTRLFHQLETVDFQSSVFTQLQAL